MGPIRDADVEFGDLTVLVGPQASGKSIFLQMLMLVIDSGRVFKTLKRHGLDWSRQVESFLPVFLGEGTGELWPSSGGLIEWGGERVDLPEIVRRGRQAGAERAFFIPAQRVLALSRDGWLRSFEDYRAGDPFSVKDYSEKLRRMLDAGLGSGESIFPQPKRLKIEVRKLLSRDIFAGFHLDLEKTGPQRRLVLRSDDNKVNLPYMVWSAGQREFVPLLLGLYWLLPRTKTKRRGSLRWIMIEELEMGLHPRAIAAMLVLVLDLLWRGYRVCLSTHSPQVLELVWALRILRKSRARPTDVLDLMKIPKTLGARTIAEAALNKETRVYYFDREGQVTAHDISSLDPDSARGFESGWGGLTEFNAQVQQVVARVVRGARG